jgi:hypoxanthine phosphoribosyltransferase
MTPPTTPAPNTIEALLSTDVSPYITPLLSEECIRERIQALATEINTAYANVPYLTVLCVLKGAYPFMSDLVKHLTMPCRVEFIRVSSYGNSTASSGKVKPVDLSLPDLNGHHCLLIEDIVDTGLTLQFLLNYLETMHQPASLKTAVLLDKPTARKPETQSVSPDFVGFDIENQFVIGYGLDYCGYFRNLPYIAVYSGPLVI